MALFSRNRPVVLDSYGSSRRTGFPIPRWLMLLLFGIVVGAGGLYYIQQNHLPARLTPAESEALIARSNELERERSRLQTALDKTVADARSAAALAATQLDAARKEVASLAKERDETREAAARTQQAMALVERILPPDPRGGTVAVRAGRMTGEAGKLGYDVVLTRANANSPLKVLAEFIVAGRRASGANQNLSLDPFEAIVDAYTHLNGSLDLPDGFVPRQVTVRFIDKPGGRLLGMRVFNVVG